MSDIDLIDYLKTALNLQTDTEFANYLGITRQAIYRIRANELDLGVKQRLALLEKFELVSHWDVVNSLSAKVLAEQFATRIQDTSALETLSTMADPDSFEANQQLLKLVRIFIGSEKDEDFAPKIGLQRTMLSSVRKGKAKFGVLPRVQMLKLLAPETDFTDLEKALQSSENLLFLIKTMLHPEKHKVNKSEPPAIQPVTEYTSEKIRELRERHKISQSILATLLNISVSTVRQWESGDKIPKGPSLKLLNLIDRKGIDILSS